MSDGPSGPADESDSGLSVEEYDSFPEAPPTAFEPVIADKAPEEPKTVYRPAENVPTMESVVDDLVFPPPLPPKRPSDFETGYAAARAPGTVTEETDRHAPESDDGLLTLEEIFRKSARTEPASTSSSFGNLELAPMAPPSESKSKPWDGDSRPVEDEPKYGAPPLPSQQAPTVVAPAISFADLKLVDIEETRSRHNNGAVLVLAGIGGPDAVRKLLADLPQGFSRPVLVQLRLDGGRYDNLVRQISRVSSQPVRLAEADEELESSIIYVLPDHIGLHLKHGILSFISTDQQDEIIDALPPAESAVLFLSGSDPKRVEAALMFAGQGGLVGGQSLEGCYDATAVRLLAGNGIELNTPSQLVTRLVERWGMS
ncbi:MAG: chemotaxis protein [Xanthomonadaceae bacterium]|nr:chemotaxis protein [Xanthomonadaceae bacterium]